MNATAGVGRGQRITLGGRLDARGASAARAVLHAAVLDGRGNLVVDMSGVEMVDAVGLGVLMGTRRLAFRHGRTLLLEACPSTVARVLGAAGLHGLFTDGGSERRPG
jgi:Anti-anti-sigma regulatory factor (antagonist of anti-sigma factor)